MYENKKALNDSTPCYFCNYRNSLGNRAKIRQIRNGFIYSCWAIIEWQLRVHKYWWEKNGIFSKSNNLKCACVHSDVHIFNDYLTLIP